MMMMMTTTMMKMMIVVGMVGGCCKVEERSLRASERACFRSRLCSNLVNGRLARAPFDVLLIPASLPPPNHNFQCRALCLPLQLDPVSGFPMPGTGQLWRWAPSASAGTYVR